VCENALFAVREISAPADIPIDTMTASQCLDVLVHADKQSARWEAVKARALTRFATLRRAGDGLEEGASEEVAVELAMNPQTAAVQISQAHDLVTRLPATTAALEAGEIDYVRAKAIAQAKRAKVRFYMEWRRPEAIRRVGPPPKL
jgi:hypothetical protein